jgi:DMSO reductase anchor subunit
MHPALSVIFFTVISGSGYGLLFLLGIGLIVDPHFIARGEALVCLLLGAGAAAAGLTSSLFHLGQPQRAWRALSQWRSSWLSREGVAASASFVPVFVLALLIWRDADASLVRAFAFALAVLAALTVYCTAQIYASLKTIRAWHNRYVTAGYFLLGVLGGAAWLLCVHSLLALAFNSLSESASVGNATLDHLILEGELAVLVALFALASLVCKILYWCFLGAAHAGPTIESATGLGRFGKVRSAEQPHTEENYLTREMGFVLARKHARRLRQIAGLLIGVVPVLLTLLLLWLPVATSTWLASICSMAIAIGITAGCFVERWLFFAEAKHVVTLYYGAAQA